MKTQEKISRRTMTFINIKTKKRKTKNVWSILKKLWLDTLWNQTGFLSENQDTLLYK